jgi:hypothetical protein
MKIGILLCLLCTTTGFAGNSDSRAPYVINSLPAGYDQACKIHAELQADGLTVKADKFLKDYIEKNVSSVYWINPEKKKRFRITNPSGWIPRFDRTIQSMDFVESEVSESKSGKNRLRIGMNHSSTMAFRLSAGGLEKWESVLHEYFSESAEQRHPGLGKKFIWAITELTLEATPSLLWAENGASAIKVCESDTSSGQIDLDLDKVQWTIIQHKLSKIDVAKENPNADVPVTEKKDQKGAAGKPNTGSEVIDAIVWQQADRYEVVKKLLEEDPDKIREISFKIKFTMHQNASITENSTPVTGVLMAAIQAKDLEMVKLLLQKGAKICEIRFPLTDSFRCPLRYAAEIGETEIHQYLKEEYRRQYAGTFRKIVFGSELDETEKKAACSSLYKQFTYQEGEEGEKLRAKTIKTCPTMKEFISVQ